MKHKHILLIVLLLVGVASLAWAQTPCLSFDGVNDYVSFGSNSAFNFSSGAATYEAWINWAVTPQNDGTGNGVVFANMVPGSAGQIIIGIHNNRLFCGTTAYQYGLSNASSYITANVWHHWAVVHTISPAHVKLYLDGIEITLTNVANQYNPQGTGFRIGSRASGALAQYFFKGKMDDVRVWNVARTATEIADNYDNELAAPLPASLVGYWKLNESGTTQTASDETGVNNGTLLPAGYVNGPQWDEEGTETLPVELSSFTAVLTAEYFVKQIGRAH
ncbi:MAG: LamG domain-containing protein, partial [Candidatus Cloacimonas sp.]|nr:LamG domain-containing protein [Candidatus Cloacimonas sp.]